MKFDLTFLVSSNENLRIFVRFVFSYFLSNQTEGKNVFAFVMNWVCGVDGKKDILIE